MTNCISPQTSKHTPHPSALTRAADFLSAYCLGFAVEDAIAMLRMEELYIVSLSVALLPSVPPFLRFLGASRPLPLSAEPLEYV